MLNIVAKRYLFFAISLIVIIPGLISLALYGLKPGIDFAGGTVWSFLIPNQTATADTSNIAKVFSDAGVQATVQISPVDAQGRVFTSIRTPEVREGSAEKAAIIAGFDKAYPGSILESFETVGATVSSESTRQAVLAVFAASVAILIYLSLAFRHAPHPIRYGVCAIIAMLHDVLIVLGFGSILGWALGLEVDALFLTALLTVISFSVHDTIVVFDRVREDLQARRSSQTFEDVVNTAVVQTLTRSINTQLTVLFTLLALLIFGGATIHHFLLILTIGLISGTYSSIFNASQLLVVWENGWAKDWRNVFGHHSVSAAA